MTSQLLNLLANPNVMCNGGYTATHAACFVASKSILSLLLKCEADLYLCSATREIPM